MPAMAVWAPIIILRTAAQLQAAQSTDTMSVAVRFATFMKKHLSLKPHLNALRKQTGRSLTARSQIDNMF